MNRIRKPTITILLALALSLVCASCCASDEPVDRTTHDIIADAGEAVSVDTSGATEITLHEEQASVSGTGAQADGRTVRIYSGGTYTVSGTLTNGRIVVDADGADVTIILCGAHITCADSSAIFIRNAKSATVYAAADSENSLTDGSTYANADPASSQTDAIPNACLYSKADLILAGSGKLTVNGRADGAIVGRDAVRIDSLTLSVDAAENGVSGKDALTIRNADVTVTADGDALRSSNSKETSLGNITVSGSTLRLTCGGDGIQAQSTLTLTDSQVTVTAGNGSTLTDEDAAKGLTAGTDLTVSGGTIDLDCADDGIHADGNVTIRDCALTVRTGDDGVHAKDALTLESGTVTVTGHEGLEATRVTINGGAVTLNVGDDGINAARQTPGVTPSVTINGGDLTIRATSADADGIDANGDIRINGGTVRIQSKSPFDFDGKGVLHGGTVYVNGKQITSLTER